jgi:hypothetical protein
VKVTAREKEIGVQGTHFNPLGLFLRTFIPFLWRILSAFPYPLEPLAERACCSQVTAGRIIPALATTTAMVCGLVDIEFMVRARPPAKSA